MNGYAFDGDVRRNGYRANGMVLYGGQMAFSCEDTLAEKLFFPNTTEIHTDGFLCFAKTGMVVPVPDSLEIKNAADRTIGLCNPSDQCVHVFRTSIDSLIYSKEPDPAAGTKPKRKRWPQEVTYENRYAIIGFGVV